jgi:imidazoleglycerol phosphate synthase glutamine amidotransferase subunit HisH
MGAPMIAVIDYKGEDLTRVVKALKYLGAKALVARSRRC